VDARDARNADEAIKRPNKRAPTRRYARISKFWHYARSHAELVVLCPGKDQVTVFGSFEHEFGSVAYRSGARLPCLTWWRVSWTRWAAGAAMRW
jgi:hypothetical protein